MREGTATSAKIMHKKEVLGRSPAYTVAYEYQAPSEAVAGLASSAPVTVKASMRVSPEDFQEAVIGDEVVVLYRPERPRRSVICRYADYEFVPSAFAERPRETSGATNPLT